MNLIEQLGGYEAAKTKRDQINSTLENSELLGGGDAKEGLYERLESIEQALLEYRRQPIFLNLMIILSMTVN